MTEFISHSYDETVSYAQSYARKLPKGTVIGFLGGLGMGKTAFTAGFVKGLGIKSEVTSPTFAICNDYIGSENRVYHFDMYRVQGWDDLYSTGFFDYLDTDAYILAEWSENVFGALPDNAVIIEIEKLDDNTRRFCFYDKTEFIKEH